MHTLLARRLISTSTGAAATTKNAIEKTATKAASAAVVTPSGNSNSGTATKGKDKVKAASGKKGEDDNKKPELDGFEALRKRLKPMQKSKRDNGYDWFYKHVERKEKEEEMRKIEESKPALPEVLQKGFQRKKAFIEFAIGDKSIGRMTFMLANDIVPNTVENFLNLCSSNIEKGKYKTTTIHKIVKDIAIMGGDIDGRGGHSSFPGQRFFPDEGYAIQHRKRGILSMTSAGRDTNNSQFFITLKPLPHFDGQHVAFGYMIDGEAILKKISEAYTVKQAPVTPIVIKDCGEMKN